MQEAQEGREEAQARARDLLAETQRLEAHVSDLETRKRAPLYQKKQEEELRAAVEKAAEAELRATDAELKYKEAKVGVGLMAVVVFTYSFAGAFPPLRAFQTFQDLGSFSSSGGLEWAEFPRTRHENQFGPRVLLC